MGILDDSEKTQYLTEILSLSDDGQLKRYLNALQMSFGSATLGPVFLILDKVGADFPDILTGRV